MRSTQTTPHRTKQAAVVSCTAVLAAVLFLAPARPATAAAICTPTVVSTALGVFASPITAYYGAITVAWSNGYNKWAQIMGLVGNNGTNMSQNRVNTQVALHDRQMASASANAVAQARTELAMEYVPSRTACAHVTRQRSLARSQAYFGQERAKLNVSYANTIMGKAGTPGQNGSIGRVQAQWKNRCDKYVNVAELDIPSSLGCSTPTDATMIDLDLRVQDSLLGPLNLIEAKHKTAAQDTITLLTDVAGLDTLRGSALDRAAGQAGFVERMRYAARLGVARNALERSVALRLTPEEAGDDGRKNSRLARYIEMVTAKKVDGNALSGQLDAIAQAGVPENANKQSNLAQLSGQKMLLMEFLRMTEQMIAVEAVRLSMDVEQDSRRGGAVNASMAPN